MSRMRAKGVVLLGMAALAWPLDAAEGQTRRIIDMHLHAQNLWVEPGGVEPLSGLRAPNTAEEVQRRTLQALDDAGVVLAIASGPRAEAYRESDPDRIWASPLLNGCGRAGRFTPCLVRP